MISSTFQDFQNNRCHTQDILGSACAATLVLLASKYIQQITNLTAFAAAANGASVLMTVKSIHTLCMSSKKGETDTAENMLVFALAVATVATMLRATTVLKSRHNDFPDFNKFAKPLFATTAATVVLTEAGIRSVQITHSAYQALTQGRAESLALAKAEIAKEDFNTKGKIDALEAEAINALRGHIERVLASPADRKSVTDNLILWVNTKAGTDELNIPGWEDISKEEEGFYGRSDISVKGIYDAIIWSMMHDTLIALPEGNKEQLQLLVDLIPVHLKDNREVNRTRTKVWFVVSKVQGLDLRLGLKLRTLNDKIKGARGTAYLKSDGCDLGLLRRAAKELLAI